MVHFAFKTFLFPVRRERVWVRSFLLSFTRFIYSPALLKSKELIELEVPRRMSSLTHNLISKTNNYNSVSESHPSREHLMHMQKCKNSKAEAPLLLFLSQGGLPSTHHFFHFFSHFYSCTTFSLPQVSRWHQITVTCRSLQKKTSTLNRSPLTSEGGTSQWTCR